MSVFRDNSNREWLLEINVGAIKRVRSVLSIDLTAMDEQATTRLATDPVLLVDVLWLLCESQAKGRGVSDEDFGRSLVGDSIDSATTALLEAVTDFFPQQKRSLLRLANQKISDVRKKAMDLAMAKMEDSDLEARLEAAMRDKIERDLNDILTRLNSPMNSGVVSP